MKVLQKSNSLIDTILSKQNIKKESTYTISPFAVAIKNDSDILFYNNLTKKYIEISFEEIDKTVLKYENNKDLILFKNFKYSDDDLINLLIEDWFFVRIDEDVIKLRDNLRATALLLQQPEKHNTNFNIFTTTACNARCFYCYEAGMEAVSMSKEIADETADYIIQTAGDKLSLSWFGGEPLCNIPAIDIICNKVKLSNKVFKSQITTNGYLFDEEVIYKAKNSWNLKNVQITLDGKRDLYNKIKNYKNNDKNPYDRVINNIRQLLENNITVSIRLNMDLYNADELKQLVYELIERFNGYEKFYIYSYPLFENVASSKTSHSDEERKIITKKYLEIERIIEEANMHFIPELNNGIALYKCMADSPTTVMINPKGEFGYCETYPFEFLYSSIKQKGLKGIWSSYIPANSDCSSCAAYPTCIRLLDCNNKRIECFEYEKIANLRKIYDGMLKIKNKRGTIKFFDL